MKEKKHKQEHKDKSLKDFYTAEQRHREHMEQMEMEIFEHLKKHTKKVLEKK